MRHCDVHRVRIVIRYVLPIHMAHAHRHASERLKLLEAVAGQLVLIRRQYVGDARQARAQANKNESFVDLSFKRFEPELIEREIHKFLALRHRGERSIEIISPCVIRTNYSAVTMSRAAVEEPRGAMTADIEKCFDAGITATQRDNGLSEEIQRVVIAGIRDVVEVTYDLPRRGEHLLFFSP